MRKLIGSLVILAVIVGVILCIVFGKDTVTDVAEKVMDAAKKELTAQIEEKLEEHGVEVVEIKPALGELNDEGGDRQFFCAALVQTNSEDSAADCAKALKKVFGDAGYMEQTGRKVEHELLTNKSIAYKQKEFSEDNYYTVYVYVEDIGDIVDLDKLEKKIKG